MCKEEKCWVIDLGALIEYPELLLEDGVVLTDKVIEGLEEAYLTTRDRSKITQIKHARRVVYDVIFRREKGLISDLAKSDDKINLEDGLIGYAKTNNLGLITNNLRLNIRAKRDNIEVKLPYETNGNKYGGIFELDVEGNDEITKKLYEGDLKGVVDDLGLLENQYLILKKGNKYVGDSYIVQGGELEKINYAVGEISNPMETVRARNRKQLLAMDLLNRRDIPLKTLVGKYGSGKDYLMLNKAVELLNDESCHLEKLVFIRNNVGLEDVNEIGFLPSGLEEKLKPFMMPLIDICGGEDGFNQTFGINKDDNEVESMFELVYLGHIKGRSWKNSIIYVTEAEDLTPKHLKLLISRAGEGTEIWLNGDEKQVETLRHRYENGLKELTKLKGNKMFGMVELDKVERSDLANLATVLEEKEFEI